MAEGKGRIVMYMRLQLIYSTCFSVWGGWAYMLGAWAGAHHIAQGSLYAAFALGALFAPLVGPIADRKYAAQKVFAVMQTVCGLALLACAYFAATEGALADEAFAKGGSDAPLSNPSFVWQAAMFVAGFFFLPSIPVLNTIVFRHIPDKTKSTLIFVAGTIGWTVVNWVLSYMGEYGVEYFYIVAAGLAFVSAIYALTLPNTPPSGAKNNDPFGLKALRLFTRWDFASFIICATMVSCFGSNYYFPLVGMCFPDKGVWNQYSEIVFMTALAFFVAKIGLKWTLTIGMAVWSARYVCFATGNDSLAAAGILLHGIAYSCLYAVAYLYADKVASKDLKASAQALVAFWLLGVSQAVSGIAVDIMLDIGKCQGASEKTAVVLAESAYAQDAALDETVAPVAETPAAGEAVSVPKAPVAEEAPAAVDAEPVAKEKKSFADSLTFWDRAKWNEYNWSIIFGFPAAWCLFFGVFFALFGKEPKAAEEEK